MKKLISLSLIFLCVLTYSQWKPSELKTHFDGVKYTPGSYFGYFWGAAGDTLNASDTLTQIFAVEGDGFLQMTFTLKTTKVSGTLTNKLIFYKSNINSPYYWQKVDSIVNTNLSSGYSIDKTISNWNDSYLKAELISPATAQRGAYEVIFRFRY